MALIDPIDFISKSGKLIKIKNASLDEALKLRDAAVEIAKTSPFILHTAEDFKKKTKEDQEKFISSHNDSDTALLIVAEFQGQIIGKYNFGSFKDLKRKHRGSLGISIHQDFRQQGIAQKLFEVCFEHVKKIDGLKFVELDVMGANKPAFNLYEKIGFKTISILPNAYRLADNIFTENITMRIEIKK